MKNVLLCILIVVLMWGCSPTIHQTHKTEPARLGAETPFHSELTSLPAPQEKLVAAVYKFRDQTGQYKPSDFGSSWSTAVTQGATTILIRSLEESGWFRPLERENLGNLSAERQIITNTLATYEGKSQTALSPLLFAGIILEGGIISYETNVRTGGAGLRYFGAGASGQYREDRVSIYLRAVSTKNGEILKTVYSTKSILSQKIDFSVFRYVKFKRLLEAETGITYNEPSEMAVTEAIEKAVYSLIIEGIVDGLWAPTGTVAEVEQVVNDYLQEKNENAEIDYLGRKLSDKRSMVSLGIVSGFTYPDVDSENSDVGFSSGINLNIRLSPVVSFDNEVVYGQLDSKVLGDNQYIAYTPSLRFDMLPK
ncbi:MAG: CsgG/HfaB family protein [Bacteroidales bacterium]|nr:CsgG/HfaB family protein [Bacteroidales bacterium]